jgi:hypothetical protein
MSAANPRYYKWYPTEETDLGTMPFEGDFTVNDRIVQMDATGMQKIYVSNATGTEFGRYVNKKVGNRIKQVWEPGVTVGPVTMINPYTQEEVQAPVWFIYCGDGVCTVKLPNGEQPEPVET